MWMLRHSEKEKEWHSELERQAQIRSGGILGLRREVILIMVRSHWRLTLGGIWNESHPVVSNSLQPLGLWNFPGQNTGVGSHSLFQEIFLRDRTQVSHVAGGFFTSWAVREAWVSITNNQFGKCLAGWGRDLLQNKTCAWYVQWMNECRLNGWRGERQKN